MNRWYGKLIGVVLGIALLRFSPLFGALVGLLIGHAFDAGWFSGGSGGAPGRQRNRSGGDRSALDDPYAVLGVSAEASDAEIERAYRRLISRHHPDRVAGEPGEPHRQAAARAGEINRAYKRIKTLRKPSK